MSAKTAELWLCESCGFVSDPAEGDPDGGIPPETQFDETPRQLGVSGARSAQVRLRAARMSAGRPKAGADAARSLRTCRPGTGQHGGVLRGAARLTRNSARIGRPHRRWPRK